MRSIPAHINGAVLSAESAVGRPSANTIVDAMSVRNAVVRPYVNMSAGVIVVGIVKALAFAKSTSVSEANAANAAVI